MVSLCSGRIWTKTLCWKTSIRLIKRLTGTTTTSGFGDQFTKISMSFSFLTLGNLDAESLAIGTVGHTSHVHSDGCHWVFEWCFPSLEGVVIVCVNSICSPDTYWNAHLLCRGNTMPRAPAVQHYQILSCVHIALCLVLIEAHLSYWAISIWGTRAEYFHPRHGSQLKIALLSSCL